MRSIVTFYAISRRTAEWPTLNWRGRSGSARHRHCGAFARWNAVAHSRLSSDHRSRCGAAVLPGARLGRSRPRHPRNHRSVRTCPAGNPRRRRSTTALRRTGLPTSRRSSRQRRVRTPLHQPPRGAPRRQQSAVTDRNEDHQTGPDTPHHVRSGVSVKVATCRSSSARRAQNGLASSRRGQQSVDPRSRKCPRTAQPTEPCRHHPSAGRQTDRRRSSTRLSTRPRGEPPKPPSIAVTKGITLSSLIPCACPDKRAPPSPRPASSPAGVTAPGIEKPVKSSMSCVPCPHAERKAMPAVQPIHVPRGPTAHRTTSPERARPAERRAGWPTMATARLAVDALVEPVTTPAQNVRPRRHCPARLLQRLRCSDNRRRLRPALSAAEVPSLTEQTYGGLFEQMKPRLGATKVFIADSCGPSPNGARRVVEMWESEADGQSWLDENVSPNLPPDVVPTQLFPTAPARLRRSRDHRHWDRSSPR